jgi:CubicO group peptidase (beta-lactamase class C family)
MANIPICAKGSESKMRSSLVKSKEFDDFVEKTMKEWRVPGLALAVVDGDSTIVKVSRLGSFQ